MAGVIAAVAHDEFRGMGLSGVGGFRKGGRCWMMCNG